jgi:hypothetical protein
MRRCLTGILLSLGMGDERLSSGGLDMGRKEDIFHQEDHPGTSVYRLHGV